MKSLNENKIQQQFNEIAAFNNEKEKYNLDLFILQNEILQEVQMLLDEANMSRSDLAEQLHTSKSFVTQLFTGDKLLNLKHILALQKIFKKKFVSSFQSQDTTYLQLKYSKINFSKSLNRANVLYHNFSKDVNPSTQQGKTATA